jgi:hypothetical protein
VSGRGGDARGVVQVDIVTMNKCRGGTDSGERGQTARAGGVSRVVEGGDSSPEMGVVGKRREGSLPVETLGTSTVP